MKTDSIRISNSDKIGMMISYATMLSSGITLVEATTSLLEDSKGNQKKVLQVIHNDISQGKQLNLSFEKFPSIFDKVTVNIIKAAEESGTLDTTLKQIVTNIKKDMEFTDKVKSALFYPCFIIVVFIGMLVMILVIVVPKIATVFLNLRVALPLPTRILIFLSDLILKYTFPTLIGVFIFFTITIVIFKTRRRALTQAVFSLPLINRLIIKIDLTRLTRNLASLLQSGIIITTALDLTEDIVINKQVHAMLTTSKQMVLSGKNLTEGMKASKKIIPSIVIRIIESGEKSGSLEKSLQEVAEYLDYEVTGLLKTLTTLMEPIMLVIVGVLIGGMMISIIAPIYSLISKVGAM